MERLRWAWLLGLPPFENAVGRQIKSPCAQMRALRMTRFEGKTRGLPLLMAGALGSEHDGAIIAALPPKYTKESPHRSRHVPK
jgi:hypothetical protein